MEVIVCAAQVKDRHLAFVASLAACKGEDSQSMGSVVTDLSLVCVSSSKCDLGDNLHAQPHCKTVLLTSKSV
jgi:hypothetical protein